MTNAENTPKQGEIVEVIPETQNIVTKHTPETDEVQEATKELIDAIRKKAQSEAQKAGDFAREAYLNAIKAVQTEVENRNIFEPERIEEAIKRLQTEVEKDWDSLVKQVTDLGDRLPEAAKTAWDILTTPKTDKK